MILSSNYQSLILYNLEPVKLFKTIILNKSLLSAKLNSLKNSDQQKPLFLKHKTIGSNDSDEQFTCLIQIDHKTIATGSFDQTIKLWDIYRSNVIKTLEGHTSTVSDLLLFRSNLVSCCLLFILVWDLKAESVKSIRKIKVKDPLHELKQINKNLFLAISQREIIIFNQNYEKVKSLKEQRQCKVVTSPSFIIYQTPMEAIKILHMIEISKPMNLFEEYIESTCCVLLNTNTIVLSTIKFEVILGSIDNSQIKDRIKSTSKYQKLF
jgi:WD40 repeat protein